MSRAEIREKGLLKDRPALPLVKQTGVGTKIDLIADKLWISHWRERFERLTLRRVPSNIVRNLLERKQKKSEKLVRLARARSGNYIIHILRRSGPMSEKKLIRLMHMYKGIPKARIRRVLEQMRTEGEIHATPEDLLDLPNN